MRRIVSAINDLFPAALYNQISGGVPSNGSDASNDISFTAGVCAAASGNYLIPIPAYTKKINATFAVGGTASSPAGGLPSSLSISNTTYHPFVVFNPKSGLSDIGFDTSTTATNLLADTVVASFGMTEYRRIFSLYRAGGANVAFTALESAGGGLFVTLTTRAEITANNPGTSAVTRTLSVPTGVIMISRIIALLDDNSATPRTQYQLVTALTETDSTPAFDMQSLGIIAPLLAVGEEEKTIALDVPTNTSGQIRTRNAGTSDANLITRYWTLGWIDNRVS